MYTASIQSIVNVKGIWGLFALIMTVAAVAVYIEHSCPINSLNYS